MNYNSGIHQKAIKLRALGKSYVEICEEIELAIPKSTLSTWFRGIELPRQAKDRLNRIKLKKLAPARLRALEVKDQLRRDYLQAIENRLSQIPTLLQDNRVAKIVLAMLYWTEGSKTTKTVVFGNSNPSIVATFLRLLRQCYGIDESKFRCTLQLRADQNAAALTEYWTEVTAIPKHQFYAPRFDRRTLGRPTRKMDYRGVCRIDYFSAEIFIELTKLAELISGPVA